MLKQKRMADPGRVRGLYRTVTPTEGSRPRSGRIHTHAYSVPTERIISQTNDGFHA